MRDRWVRADPLRSAFECVAAIACTLAALLAHAHPEIELQIERVSQEIAAHPADATLYLRRGELARIHQDWDAARADFATARHLAPDLPVVDFHVGRLELEAGRLAEARAALDRFLAKEPAHVEALATRARVLDELGLGEAAAADLTRAIEAVPPDDRPQPSYYIDRARALASVGKADRAIAGLDEGLARLGQPVTLELYAIDLEIGLGRYDAALARLSRIAAKSERQESWLVRRGEILEMAGRKPEAVAAYESAIAAIRSLPAARRSTRAVAKLEAASEAALARLSAPTSTAPASPEAP